MALPAITEMTDRQLADLPRVRRFIELMVWEAKPLAEAAREAGLRAKRARWLLKRPDVKSVYAREIEVLRAGEGARNIHMAVGARDKGMAPGASAAQQKVALEAAKYLDGEDAHGSGRGVNVNVNVVTPGYVTVIPAHLLEDRPSGAKVIEHQPQIEAKPLPHNDHVGQRGRATPLAEPVSASGNAHPAGHSSAPAERGPGGQK